MGKRSIIPVRANVRTIDGFWAHADQQEILRWLGSFKKAPKKTFVIHGEPPASEALAALLREKLKWVTEVPRNAAMVVLS
jgi:metallo-beta-lactamase family protein